jgi:hypothetical protein
MQGELARLAANLSANTARGLRAPPRDSQALWFSLTGRNWNSVVLVPADAEGSTAPLATSLASVGKWLGEGLVTAITEEPLDRDCANRIATILESTKFGGGKTIELVVSIPPVVVDPVGLAVTQAADAVILCIQKGRTRLAAARRSIELIGRDRIAGCFLSCA